MLKRLLILLWLIPTASGATPLLDVGTQYVSQYVTSGGFGWWSRYDISFSAQDLIIDVDIQLLGDDPGLDLIQQWEQGIEHIWGDTFDIVDGSYLYDLVFNVDWVDSGADQSVNVVAGTGPTNMRTWYTDRPNGWSNSYHDEIAAHEFGHMIGLYDEYYGGAMDPATSLLRSDSIMGAYLTDPHEDHYDPFLGWLVAESGRDLSLTPDSGSHYYAIPVPEPTSLALMSLGLAGLGFARRRALAA